jgi:hypothetical protein
MRLSFRPWCLGLAALYLSATSAWAVDVFRDQVEPILRQRCYECHSHAGKIKGGVGAGLALGMAGGR